MPDSGIKKKPSVILSIPLVWGIRNIFNSGLLGLLEKEFTVYLAVPPTGVQDILNLGVLEGCIIILSIPKTTRIMQLALLSLKEAHRYQKSTKSDEIFGNWYKQSQPQVNFKRKVVLRFLTSIAESKKGFLLIEKFIQKLYSLQLSSELKNRIKKIHPIAALSTSYVSSWEWPLFNYLQDQSIPTATHILSFDNLTSRGYFPLKRFDQYYTWQQNMSDELIHFFDIDPKKIKITGTPQFDFHILPSFYWDRQKTSLKLGIDPDRPYIAYCANHYKHTPGESDLIAFLIRTLHNIEQFKDIQWVVRIHPMDQFKRWESFFSDTPNVVLSHPWKREDALSYWGTPDNEEIALLGNTLRYATATVTMASTVALDSCVTDTPIICVGFHPNKNSAEDHYYHDVHFSHHYEPIISSGAVSFVQSIEEFVAAMITITENPKEKSGYREKLESKLCGVVDGKTANRIAEEFSRFVL